MLCNPIDKKQTCIKVCVLVIFLKFKFNFPEIITDNPKGMASSFAIFSENGILVLRIFFFFFDEFQIELVKHS